MMIYIIIYLYTIDYITIIITAITAFILSIVLLDKYTNLFGGFQPIKFASPRPKKRLKIVLVKNTGEILCELRTIYPNHEPLKRFGDRKLFGNGMRKFKNFL